MYKKKLDRVKIWLSFSWAFQKCMLAFKENLLQIYNLMLSYHRKITISRQSYLRVQIHPWSSWYCLLNLHGYSPKILDLNSTKELADLNLGNSFAQITSALYVTVSRPKLTVFLLSLESSGKCLKLYKFSRYSNREFIIDGACYLLFHRFQLL